MFLGFGDDLYDHSFPFFKTASYHMQLIINLLFTMSKNGFESPDTLTPGSPLSVRKSSGKGLKARSSPRCEVRSNRKRDDSKFGVAIRKALVARSRVLGRRLHRDEFTSLVRAVRKQCLRRFSSTFSIVLSEISERITRLERVTPKDGLDLQDSIGMFAAQVSVLREQAVQAMQQRDELSETCSHFSKRKLIRMRCDAPVLHKEITGLGTLLLMRLPSETVLCCDSCVSRREEALFYWTGCSLSDFSDMIQPDDEITLRKSGLSKVRPLAHQKVWAAVLDLQYSREYVTPVTG